jgi:hypothetical protein
MPLLLQRVRSSRPTAHAIVLLVYAAATLAVYGTTLNMFFASDDFYFLGIVAPARNMLVIFEPLVGRFVRPLVVGLYYVNYHLFGLTPWPYHVSTLLPHLAAGWFIYLIARRLAGDSEALWAFLAGLLFIVFGGHSEAASWPAGAADPILAAALTAAFYAYLRAIEPGAPWRWLALFFGALLIATQAKEAWAMFPGVLVAHAVVFGPGKDSAFADRVARRRAIIAIAGASALVIVYLLIRRIVFGSVAGGYGGLSSSFGGSTDALIGQLRAFLLKCFVPSGHYPANLWLSGRDIFIWPIALIAIVAFARGRPLRMIAFAALATACALAPVIPLTISISTTESERYIYIPTVFSCILLVWAVRAVVKWRPAAVAICVAMLVLHSAALLRANVRWSAAGTLSRSIIHTFADRTLQHDPQGRSEVYLLNLADNIGGPFVFRVGFYEAIALVRPEVMTRSTATVGVATHSLVTATDRATLTRTGPRSFAIDFGRNGIVQPEIPSSFTFRISNQTRTSYHIEFTEALDRAIVLYLTDGRLEFAGAIESLGVPFGVVDIPAGEAVCSGQSIRFAGWALDWDRVRRVTLTADAGGTPRLLGEGVWRPGMRPDVAAKYRAYPEVERAGWDFELPCKVVTRSAEGAMHVRVTVEDMSGLSRVIGERLVRAR